MSDDPNTRLNPVAFYDPSNFTACTIAAGYAAQGTLQAPSYSKAASVVTLRGTAKATETKAAGQTITTLPAGHRPPVAIKVATVTTGGTAGALAAARLSITAAGVVSVDVELEANEEVDLNAIFSTEATV